jgi:hypothetical protein
MSEPPNDGVQTGGVAWPDERTEASVWAHHLRQDILHDKLVDTSYADTTASPAGAAGGEGGTYDFLVDLAQADPNFRARTSKLLSFSINTGTETFQKWNPPVLYGANNASIGIVQDAGKFITKLLGAQNVITFGHILDPAGTTTDPKTDPILYIPPAGQNSVQIDLKQFGFNPAIIPSIEIQDFTPGTVKCVWQYNGVATDAVSTLAVVKDIPLMAKRLNNPRPDDAGFFVSRNDATGEGNLRRGIDLRPYKIGKTLGDTMLVASAMPTFSDGSVNPFYGGGVRGAIQDAAAGRVGWQRYAVPKPPELPAAASPDILMLKTGDQLNHLRAILKDVPSILEKPPAGGRGVIFQFFPGVVTDEQLILTLSTGLRSLPDIVTRKYNELIASFRTLAPPGGAFNVANARFTAGEPSIDANSTRSAWVVIDKICEQLGFVRDHIAGIFTILSQPPDKQLLTYYKRLYETANELANRLSPPTSSIFTERGLLKQKIVVICAPSGGYKAPLGYIQPIVVELHPLFMMLKRNRTDASLAAGGGWDVVLYPRINGSSFDTNFFRRAQSIVPIDPGGPARSILASIAAMAGGARTPKSVSQAAPFAKTRVRSIFSSKGPEEVKIDVPLVPIDDYDRDAFDEFIASLTRGYAPAQVNLPPLHPVPEIYNERIVERAPLLLEFGQLIREGLGQATITSGQVIAIIERLNARRYEIPIYSASVLDELIDEVNGLVPYPPQPPPPPTPLLPLPLMVQQPPVAPVPMIAADAFTILYNAFIFRKNAHYASDPGLTGEVVLDDLGFTKYSTRLIRSLRGDKTARPTSSATVTLDKSGTAILPDSVARRLDVDQRITLGGSDTPIGGLRPRRPLYSNVQVSDSLPLVTDDDSGLRKRTRTRRTRRVRQSTRKSKTRR